MNNVRVKLDAALTALTALTALAALGCDGNSQTTKPTGGSESHFLRACDSDGECGALACIAGVCTRACEQAAECAALSAAASCAADVCDVLCENNAVCAALDPAFACTDGRCREAEASARGGDGGGLASDGSVAQPAIDGGRDAQTANSGDDDAIAAPVIVDAMPGTKRHACVTYEIAERTRTAECWRVRDSAALISPFAFGDECPGRHFAEGTTNTVESLYACAEAWRDYSCTELARGVWPACASRGAGTSMDACQFGSQCQSGSCLGAASGIPLCNTCSQPVPESGDCSADKIGSCDSGLTCVDDVCVPQPEYPMRALGEICQLDQQCPMPHVCVSIDGAPATCMAHAELGEPCGWSTQVGYMTCAEGLSCTTALRCEAPAPAGEPCLAAQEPSALEPVCDASAYCDEAGMCRALPEEGEACAPIGLVPCAQHLGCFDGTCHPRSQAGQPCQSAYYYADQGSCRTGLSCACPDITCSVGGDGVCLQLLPEGAACGGPDTRCAMRTSCVAGVCVADDALTPWEGMCTP